MRYQGLGVLLCCALLNNCAATSDALRQKEGWLILETHGGDSQTGRRIVLWANGTYVDTKYGGVVGDQSRMWGTYSFDASQERLTIRCDCGEHEVLYRVDYKGWRYWVSEQDRIRIAVPAENQFREMSLRSEKQPGA